MVEKRYVVSVRLNQYEMEILEEIKKGLVKCFNDLELEEVLLDVNNSLAIRCAIRAYGDKLKNQ